jgi:hypothetical protein
LKRVEIVRHVSEHTMTLVRLKITAASDKASCIPLYFGRQPPVPASMVVVSTVGPAHPECSHVKKSYHIWILALSISYGIEQR